VFALDTVGNAVPSSFRASVSRSTASLRALKYSWRASRPAGMSSGEGASDSASRATAEGTVGATAERCVQEAVSRAALAMILSFNTARVYHVCRQDAVLAARLCATVARHLAAPVSPRPQLPYQAEVHLADFRAAHP
jgi:hypothetical protein